MSRIRSIHPGIFTDEAFMTLTVENPMAIPLLIGLWTEADDSGVFEWKPLTIKARILPAASANVVELLETLVRAGFVMAYEAEGKQYGAIRNFVKFQRPKEPKDIHPATPQSRAYAGFNSDGSRPHATTGRKSTGTTSEPLPKSTGTTSEKSSQMEDGGGRVVEEKKESLSELGSDPSAAGDEKPKPTKRQRIDYPEDFEAFWRVYPTDPNMSKPEALKVWKKLDDDDRRKAQDSLPAFLAYCRNDPSYRPIHAERYLKYRRFDGFAPGAAQSQAASRAPSPDAVTPDRWRGMLKAYISTGGNWPGREISPEPGFPGCRVPREILAEFEPELRRVVLRPLNLDRETAA